MRAEAVCAKRVRWQRNILPPHLLDQEPPVLPGASDALSVKDLARLDLRGGILARAILRAAAYKQVRDATP